MILKKVIENGKVVYEEISFKDALKYENKDELVFTDEDEEDEFEDTLEDLEDELEDLKDLKEDENEDFFKNKSVNSKSKNIMAMLPFLDSESLNEIVESILYNDEEYKDINLVMLFPFIGQQACDKLFVKFISENTNTEKNYITSLAPFISPGALTSFVDEYVNGNYQNVNINLLYPFMKSSDVKRVFKYVMNRK